MNGADRDDRCRGVDRHAAAIQVVQTHNAIDVGILWQQIAFDNFHHIIDDARHAVHAGANAEQVFGSDAPVGVAIAFEGIAFQRRQRRRDFGRQRQSMQRRRFWQFDQRFINPAALWNIAYCVANHLAIADNFTVDGNIDQRDFMALRDMFNERESVRETRSGL